MKTVLRTIALYTLALYFLPNIVPGVVIRGGFWTLLTGGAGLAALFLILKPILNIISFPVNMLTIGIFSLFTNAFILYLLTIFVPEIMIRTFTYESTTFFGFITPDMTFSLFFAYLFTAFVLSLIETIISWLIK
ncbi:MAG: phage holin family protein [Patescibacteria group bacterium]